MHPALTDLVGVNPLLAELQKGISSGRGVIGRPREIKSARAYGFHGLYDVLYCVLYSISSGSYILYCGLREN